MNANSILWLLRIHRLSPPSMQSNSIDGLFILPSFSSAQQIEKPGCWAHRQIDLPSEGGLIQAEKLGPICTAIAKRCTRTRRRMLSSTWLSIARRWTRGDDEREVARQKHLVMWFVSFLALVELELPPIATEETHAGLYSHTPS